MTDDRAAMEAAERVVRHFIWKFGGEVASVAEWKAVQDALNLLTAYLSAPTCDSCAWKEGNQAMERVLAGIAATVGYSGHDPGQLLAAIDARLSAPVSATDDRAAMEAALAEKYDRTGEGIHYPELAQGFEDGWTARASLSAPATDVSPELREALLDLTDGQAEWHEIQEHTGKPEARCREIADLIIQLRTDPTRPAALPAVICSCGDHCQAPGAVCATCAAELRQAAEDRGAYLKRLRRAVIEQLRRAVNAACTCGGAEPGAGCPACEVWHMMGGDDLSVVSAELNEKLVEALTRIVPLTKCRSGDAAQAIRTIGIIAETALRAAGVMP